MHTSFDPIGACIYCGATDCRLTDEHIIPYALNGTLVLPQASCDACSEITKRFEQVVARSMYGTLRITRGFRTRRKKERPTVIPVATLDETGVEVVRSISVSHLPTTYIALELPPPGILTNAPKSTGSPEMKLILKGNRKEIGALVQHLGGQLEIPNIVAWGPFCLLLAKIGHAYAAAVLRGIGYEPLLPELILGRSEHLSYYVGGANKEATSDLILSIVPLGSETYLSVQISILGPGRLPPYQAIVGKVTDPAAVDCRAREWAGRSPNASVD